MIDADLIERGGLQKNSKSWDTSVAMMRNINPIIIPSRNHQVERVISRCGSDLVILSILEIF